MKTKYNIVQDKKQIRITIPKELVIKYKIKKGTQFIWYERNNKLFAKQINSIKEVMGE